MIFQNSLGVDIQDNRVLLVHLQMTIAGIKPISSAEFLFDKELSVSEKLKLVQGHVSSFIEKEKILATEIHLGIPRSLAIVRTVKLPFAAKENYKKIIQYEMGKYIPISVEDIFFDCQLISEDKGKNEVEILLVVSRKKDLDPYLEFSSRLSSGVSGIEIASMAAVNYFSGYTPVDSDFILINQSHDRIEFCAVKEGGLFSSKEISTGEVCPDKQQNIFNEIKLITKSLFSSSDSIDIVIFGASVDDRYFDDLKSESSLKRVPYENISDIAIGKFAASFGLALKGLKKVPVQINLLPVQMRKRPGRTGYYIMLGLMAGLLLSFFVWAGSNMVNQKNMNNMLDNELMHLQKDVSAINEIQQKSAVIENRLDFLSNMINGQVAILDILNEISSVLPTFAWVSHFTYSEKKGVIIEGEASSASELIPLLEASPIFKNVVFLSTINKNSAGKEKFKIGFQIAYEKN